MFNAENPVKTMDLEIITCYLYKLEVLEVMPEISKLYSILHVKFVSIPELLKRRLNLLKGSPEVTYADINLFFC